MGLITSDLALPYSSFSKRFQNKKYLEGNRSTKEAQIQFFKELFENLF